MVHIWTPTSAQRSLSPQRSHHIHHRLSESKATLTQYARELGARVEGNLTEDVTHLIADRPGSEKYRFALELGMHIINPDWILQVREAWLAGQDVDAEELERHHQLPALSNTTICFSAVAPLERRSLSALAKELGATVSDDCASTAPSPISSRPPPTLARPEAWSIFSPFSTDHATVETAAENRLLHASWQCVPNGSPTVSRLEAVSASKPTRSSSSFQSETNALHSSKRRVRSCLRPSFVNKNPSLCHSKVPSSLRAAPSWLWLRSDGTMAPIRATQKTPKTTSLSQ